MDTTGLTDQEKELARQRVDQFVRRFEESYRRLAYHAALPLVLTPELLNYLRNQFLRGQVPWVAEVDLLLSDLCSPVGYELYAMDTAVRAYLLEEMKQELGEKRMQDVARLLISYVRQLARTNPFIGKQELQVQQWSAMLCLEEHSETAVREMAQAFVTTAKRLVNPAEMARLARIIKELAPQLSAYQVFVDYAKVTSQMLIDPSSVDQQALSRSYHILPDLELFVPSQTQFLKTFTFDVVTVDAQGREHSRSRHQAQYFTEDLGKGVTLEMVSIPGGTFTMGAPKTEKESTDDERPQHEVTVPPFFMGKYPITQAQWQAVAALPQVNRELDPDPSSFKGSDRPVENVSWYDADEFCARLSKATGRDYRLPSEAEWEYACRAGTTTPFHFGETITPELANYNGKYTYGAGSKGEYRQETTPVGKFQVTNAFGLSDMHGNVWEWCADHWHENYESSPPLDGSAWLETTENNENDNHLRLLRGGSWLNNPEYCRSAYRNGSAPDNDNGLIGFRVVCVPPSRS
ncbi:MAG: formylglycine-generating enzyme family protein [Stigonema ocellatum SAG 48.90 = DSM 106950]|nr:formylglycine-generating enzyme family protein [Stigonema ocellatum SAG 48.90 = DSM 106950]